MPDSACTFTRIRARVRAPVRCCDTDVRLRGGMRSEVTLHRVSQNCRMFPRPGPLQGKLNERLFGPNFANRSSCNEQFNLPSFLFLTLD